jgi:hypothetical protein
MRDAAVTPRPSQPPRCRLDQQTPQTRIERPSFWRRQAAEHDIEGRDPVKKLVLLVAVPGLLMLAASVAQAAGPSVPGKPTITLNLLDVQTNSAFTGSQNQRPKPGDRAWFHNNTYKWKAGRRGALIGHTDGTVVVLAGSLGELSAVAYLPGGTLDALGQNNFNSPVNTFAIVGGTGGYATARGEVIVRSLGNLQNSNKSAITVRVWL